MRAAAMSLVIATLACSNKPDERQDQEARRSEAPRAHATFKCRRQGFEGGPWRECSTPDITKCDLYGGCFEREDAYCFPVLFEATNKRWTICTPTEKECQEWNEDRKNVPNRSLGPCVLSKPDEYVDLK